MGLFNRKKNKTDLSQFQLKHYETRIFNRVNPAVRFSVTRFVLTIGLFIGVVLFGLLSSTKIGVDMFPSVNIPVVSVNTSYSGAGPQVIDSEVTQVIENAVSTIAGISDINSSSNSGSSRVSITFGPDVDRNGAVNQISAAVASAARRLPEGAGTPAVQSFDPNSQPVMQFGVSAPGVPLEDVAEWIDNNMIPQMEHVDGIASITTDGGPSRQFVVYLSPDRLQYFKLNPAQVVSALSAASVNQPIGTITANNSQLTYTTRNQHVGAAEIEQTMVDQTQGIRVRDLGSVRDMPVVSNFARVNGQPVVLVTIQRTTESNAVAVVDGVREFLKKAQFPVGYTVVESNDTTGAIRASIESTYHELFMTLLVVAIICLLFLGKLNTAISVIVAIPISLAAAPILYSLLGFSFNLVSLLALIVAIGIVVDDSIVVSENVDRYKAMGYSLKESVLRGASEVFSAVVAASLSILSVLIPVSFVGGFAGRYLQQFSLGLSAAVLLSLLEAILFLTVRLAYTPDSKAINWRVFGNAAISFGAAFKWGFGNWKKVWALVLPVGIVVAAVLTKIWVLLVAVPFYPVIISLLYYGIRFVFFFLEALTETLHGITEKAMSWISTRYMSVLSKMLKRSALVLVAVVVVLGGAVALVAPSIPFNFVPANDTGTIQAGLRMPQGTDVALTNVYTDKLEKYLLNRPEVVSVQTTVNGASSSMLIQLVSVEHRPSATVLTQTFRKEMQPLIADQVSARLQMGGFGGFMGGGGGSSLSLSMRAPSLDLMLERNDAIIQVLQNNKYVADVTSGLSDTNIENVFVPDAEKLKGTGISAGTVAQLLQTYTSGSQASTVQVDGQSYPITVKIDPQYLKGGESLLALPVYSSTLQTSLTVGQLGVFDPKPAPQSINRFNRLYSSSLRLNLNADAPASAVLQPMLIQELRDAGLLEGGIEIGAGSSFGPAALAADLGNQIIPIFGLAFFLAYLVMAAQFNSWRYPIYLLLPVPLAIAGAIIFVWATGSGLDVFGFLGMLMLIGLSAKNAIIYLDFVVERIGKMDLKDALVEAAGLRFRPIVMTTLTVLVISFPLVFSGGQGSEFGQKLGVVMLGGIFSSAILTFFVVPAAFYLFERNRKSPPVRHVEGDGLTELPPKAADSLPEAAVVKTGA